EEINRKEPQDKLNNGESSEDNSTHQISQEAATSESTKQIDKVETVEHMDEESRDLVDDKMPSTEVVEEELPQPQFTKLTVRDKETIEGHTEDS
ncbi:hypothetical protein A2U01_0024135, partial [Trifolium medium]|nr:hypothetical protein [Trifolium medium]